MAYRDLFKGTAKYYSHYRPGYPKEFFADVVEKFVLDGTGSLLDLGCGTGQLAIPLARYFKTVIAMDPEIEMLREGRRQAKRLKIKNIRWVRGDSETLSQKIGKIKLAVMGRSFHWMNRLKTLKKLYQIVEPGGGIVIIAERDIMPETKIRWKKAVKKMIQKYLGEERWAGSGVYKNTGEPHQKIIARSPFKRSTVVQYKTTRLWTIESILGHLYSTSFSSRQVLGLKRRLFEKDLKQGLRALNPKGRFTERVNVQAIFIRR